MQTHPTRNPQAGDLLLDALVALALLAFCAIAVLTLGQMAIHVDAEANALEQARQAAVETLQELDQVGWHRLPEYFAAADDDVRAALDTSDGSAPPAWRRRVDSLRGALLRVELAGVDAAGASAPFDQALALKLELLVEYDEAGHRRRWSIPAVRL